MLRILVTDDEDSIQKLNEQRKYAISSRVFGIVQRRCECASRNGHGYFP